MGENLNNSNVSLKRHKIGGGAGNKTKKLIYYYFLAIPPPPPPPPSNDDMGLTRGFISLFLFKVCELTGVVGDASYYII